MQKRKNWTPEEDSLIKRFSNSKNKPKWSKILKSIKALNPQFERTAKQIRERWTSNLNPNLQYQDLTNQEEETVFKSYLLHGSQWKKIQKMLPNRSTKSIKNFFYKTLRKSLRRITKILGSKQSTAQSRQIKPQIITKLLESMADQTQKQQLLFSLFQLSRVKNRQCKQVQFEENDQQRYTKLIDDIMYYNQIYVVNKKLGIKALEERQLLSNDQRSSKFSEFLKQTSGQTKQKLIGFGDPMVKIQQDLNNTLPQSNIKIQEDFTKLKFQPQVKIEASPFEPYFHEHLLLFHQPYIGLKIQNCIQNQVQSSNVNLATYQRETRSIAAKKQK